ncbi:hypothetical protein MSG28_002450 [Choristoneura fumiferana]|uniref:Uncharacterized protein n=1 Tax=Choristoneura fumiferana TaxID=7141 RepID=A0ACC0JVS5_CHOFU|nr:hypothetical protein MSG28_002450 [Choristoneura fumiferana]
MAHALKKLSVQVLKNNNVEAIGAVAARSSHWWGQVKMGPPDVILGITEAFKRDQDPKKVNLGVGAYRDDEGKPFAEEILHSRHLNHEYAPISGEAAYTEAVAKLAFGDNSPIFSDKSYCTVQTLSGTGALRLGLEFISKYYGKDKVVYLPDPTWGNHPQICNQLGIQHKKYRYFDPKTIGFDLQGALEDINKIPEGSIIMLHACAHNPTGVDPKQAEWKQLSEGFATGDVDGDSFAVRLFVSEGHQDVKLMADRIITMRSELRKGLEGAGSKLPWQHITDQIGMFCFTGLKPDQVERLAKEFHIYLTKDGRISVAGLFSKNVHYVAEAMHKVSS